MGRPSKKDSQRPADKLRTRRWFFAVLRSFCPESSNPRAVDLQEIFERAGIPLDNARTSAWSNGRQRPSHHWLARIKRKNHAAAAFAAYLDAPQAITKSRIDNLFLVLDAAAVADGRRGRCFTYLDQLAVIWRPRIEKYACDVAVRYMSWRCDAIWSLQPSSEVAAATSSAGSACSGGDILPESDVGLLISAAVARKVNPMDPLTALDYHLGLGVEVWLQLRGVKGDNAFQDPEVLKMPWLHDWAFDLCCQVLLISTLVRDEMSDAELFLVGHAADAAMFLRKFFFHPGFDDADPQRLARTLDDLKFERSIELAPLLLSARKVVLGELSDIKCDVQRLRDVFPRLMPGLSDSVIAGMRVAFQRRGS